MTNLLDTSDYSFGSFSFSEDLTNIFGSSNEELFLDANLKSENLLNSLSEQDLQNNEAFYQNNSINLLEADDSVSTLEGSKQSDFIFGNANNDTLKGGSRGDYLIGNSGKDLLVGGQGNDLLFGGQGNDTLRGNRDRDFLFGDRGNDTLKGGKDEDFLFGGQGNDYLDGGADRDWLYGGKGQDILVDYDGGDRLTGGADSDEFRVGSFFSEQKSIVTDFQPGIDRLKILRFGANWSNLTLEDTKEGVIVSEQGKAVATLYDVKASSLTEDSLIFSEGQLTLESTDNEEGQINGELQVPLNWKNPEGEQIEVAFSLIRAKNSSKPAEGTILGLSGGPGAAITDRQGFEDALGGLTEDYNLLLVDYRGFGQSTSLNSQNLVGIKNTFSEIREEALRLGPKVRFFNTANAVADIDAVRAALDIDKVIPYGYSYGTLPAQVYSTHAPEQIEAIVMDSVTLPNRINDNSAIEGSLQALKTLASDSSAWQDSGIDPIELWSNTVRQIRNEKDPSIGISDLISITSLASSPTFGREWLAVSQSYLNGDPLPLRRIAEEMQLENEDFLADSPEPNSGASAALSNYLAAYISYYSNDDSLPYDKKAGLNKRLEQLDRYFATTDLYQPFTGQEFRNNGSFNGTSESPSRSSELDIFANWIYGGRGIQPLPNNVEYSDIPTLVIGGEFDTTTSFKNSQILASRYPNGTLLKVGYGDHSSSISNFSYTPDVQKVLRSFIRNPQSFSDVEQLEIDSGKTYEALGSFPLTSAEIQPVTVIDSESNLSRETLQAIAAVTATANDVAYRREPDSLAYNSIYGNGRQVDGLRGGTVTYDDKQGETIITLKQTRYVEDVEVSGTIKINQKAEATANLNFTTEDGQSGQLNLSWQAFERDRLATIEGVVNAQLLRATTLVV